MSTLSAAVVNYQTPDLLKDAVRSFRAHYPDVPLEIVDNGSRDDSRAVLEVLREESPACTHLTLHDTNLFHGPAMDLAIRSSDADVVFIFDSDTITRKGGFLEPMLDRSAEPNVWAVGQVTQVDKRGFASQTGSIPVPVSAHMLIHRSRYLELPPFIHHGLPVLQAARTAAKNGWKVAEYPVQDFVDHLGRGTAERFGYSLGWRSRIDYLLHKLGL